MPSQSKIGRLPRPLQIELNRRLQRNESSTPILAWLNPLPEVQAILQTEFAGAPINKQNLSEWRATGLAKWESRQEIISEILDVDGDAAELDTATQGRLADRLATILAGRYARLLNQWDGEDTEVVTKKLRVLRSFTMDVSHLRRWDHSATRVRLEEIRVKSTQEIDNEALFAKFEEWGQNIGVQDYLMAHYETPRDRENAKRALLNLPPLPADTDPSPGARLSQPQHVDSPTTSDHQPASDRQSEPLASTSVNGEEGWGETALIKNVPSPSPAIIASEPSVQSPSQTPDPGPQTQPPASSTPSPETNPAPNPLQTLENNPATSLSLPNSVKLRRPPAPGARLSQPQHHVAAPAAPDLQPSSDCQSVPLSSIPVNGGEGRGEEARNKNVHPSSQATSADQSSVQNPASGPVPQAPSPASTPEPPEKSPLPPVCKDRCEESGHNFCRKCGLTPADIHNWPLRSEEMRRDILFRARDRRRGRF